MKKKIYFSLIILLILILPTTIVEIYLKYIGLGDPITYDSNYVYGYSPKTNQKKKRIGGAYVSINDVGLRSIHNWSDNENKKKIIFFGDSVTYAGSYIDDSETFAHIACDKLENSNIVCGNAAVNAYGIHNIVYRSKYDKRIEDAFIKVFIIVPDDFYRGLQNSQTAHFYLNKKKFFLPGITEALNFLAVKYDLNKIIGKADDTIIDTNQIDLVNESINLLLSEFVNLKKQNQKFLIFYFHPKVSTSIDKYIFNELSLKSKYEIINLKKYLDENMYYDSVHLNKLGHKNVAVKISYELEKIIKNN